MPAPGQCLNAIDVVVLAGGLGTRIRDHLPEGVPKVLAPLGRATFLDCLLARLRAFGARRVILALGHLAGAVADHLAARPAEGIDVVLSVEPEPLGTAGALRFVDAHVTTDPVLVMNGDSFAEADLCDFARRHAAAGAAASLLLARVEDAARFGAVELSEDGRIQRFREKDRAAGPGLVNAGVYLFGATLRRAVAETSGASLELDVFQALAPGTLLGVPFEGAFVDIGTPEGLARATDVLAPYRDGN